MFRLGQIDTQRDVRYIPSRVCRAILRDVSSSSTGPPTTIPSILPARLAVMMNYPWPGNARELQSAIRFALVKSKGRLIQPRHLPLELKQWQGNRPSRGPSRKLDPESVRIALARSGGIRPRRPGSWVWVEPHFISFLPALQMSRKTLMSHSLI
jgi:hypothetical protein